LIVYSLVSREAWIPYITSVVTRANSRCNISQEAKEGTGRTYLMPVWNYPLSGDPAKVIFLIGFIRKSLAAETAIDIVAQALITDYDPPNGWSGRYVWSAVLDPLNSQWIIFRCDEDIGGAGPHRVEHDRYPTEPDTAIVAAMQNFLSQNVVTYG
jgi:hypothetical protein